MSARIALLALVLAAVTAGSARAAHPTLQQLTGTVFRIAGGRARTIYS